MLAGAHKQTGLNNGLLDALRGSGYVVGMPSHNRPPNKELPKKERMNKKKIKEWLIRFFDVETCTLGWYNKTVFYKWMGWWLVVTDQQRILKFFEPVSGFHKFPHFAVWKDCKQGHRESWIPQNIQPSLMFNEQTQRYEKWN